MHRLKTIYKEYRESIINCLATQDALLQETENAFAHYVESDTHNKELLFKYALFLFAPPLADPYKAIDCLNLILKDEEYNAYALLMLAHIYDSELDGIPDELFEKLSKIEGQPPDVMAMVELAKAWFYQHKNPQKYKELLLHSIAYDSTQVNNYDYLAEYYIYQRNYQEAEKLIRIGLTNIHYVYTKKDFFNTNLRSSTEFFNERFKGIYKTTPNQESMVETLEKLIAMNALR